MNYSTSISYTENINTPPEVNNYFLCDKEQEHIGHGKTSSSTV